MYTLKYDFIFERSIRKRLINIFLILIRLLRLNFPWW